MFIKCHLSHNYVSSFIHSLGVVIIVITWFDLGYMIFWQHVRLTIMTACYSAGFQKVEIYEKFRQNLAIFSKKYDDNIRNMKE